MTRAYLNGIGWVTSAGCGFGAQGGDCVFSDQPLPALARRDVFAEPNQRFGRMSEYAKVGLAAVAFALRDAGLETWSEKRNFGVVAGTMLGCLATDLDYQRTVLLEGGGLASPNLFAYTLANCFLGDAAILFGLTGSLLALNETDPAGLAPLRMALDELELGDAQTVLAGACDLASPSPLAGCAAPLAGGSAPPPPLTGGGRGVGEVATCRTGGTFPHPLTPSRKGRGDQDNCSWNSGRNLAGAAFLVLGTEPAERGSYGAVSLCSGGGISFNGNVVGSLPELISAALAMRPVSGERRNETTSAESGSL